MDIHRHPERLDRLAAAYALGTLRGGARRRFEALARERAPVRAAALLWQSRVVSVNELQTPEQPSPAVWTRWPARPSESVSTLNPSIVLRPRGVSWPASCLPRR